MLATSIVLIFSYLIGSIPSALIVGKLGFGIDVREHGSGNLGGTNTLRTLGKKAGIIVILCDIGKGILSAALPFLFNIDIHPLLASTPAVFGHCYPIFAGFRGGKAVATTAGALLITSPILFLLSLIVFTVTLIISKYVSLSSILSSLFVFLFSLLVYPSNVAVVAFILFILIAYRHRSNISRIMNNTESKANIFKK